MDEEPGHKAMLYFLEVLMNSNGPLTISQLAGRFGSRNFTPEMRQAAGGNEMGLKKFMLKYPSLFTVTGNMVALCDGSASSNNNNGREESPSSTSSVRSLPDVSTEMEAVAFFKNKLIKKGEPWVQIKSLAGHLSQACSEVRNVVGPQIDFKKWVLRHPHIFEVQGDLVGLRDGDASITTPNLARHALEISNGHNQERTFQNRPIPPKTPPSPRRAPPKTPPPMRRTRSFGEKSAPPRPVSFHEIPPVPPPKKKDTPVTMTANEYKALMFLKDILEKRGGLKVHNITGHFSQAPEGVRNTIGWTKIELEEFLKKHQNIFTVSEDEVVSVIKNAKLNVVITGSRPPGQSNRTLTGRKGKIFHVAKLWGIIDLGKHEHVFFDKSIMKKPIDDLQREYKVGETLYFNAVLALKTSRAKWRAVEVWKEHERRASGFDMSLEEDDGNYIVSPCPSIEEEINRYLPEIDRTKENTDTFADAAPSGAGVVPVWNYSEEEDEVPRTPTSKPGGLTMVPESFYMISSTVSDLGKCSDGTMPQILTGAMKKAAVESAYGVKIPIEAKQVPIILKKKNTAEIACQTVSTGDIIATQLYYEMK